MNATLSTGARTREGKRSSSRNALKHGILAQELYFADEDDQAAIEALYAACAEELQPEGFLQEAQVDKIADLRWRQILVARSEAAGASKQHHSTAWTDAIRRTEQFGMDYYSWALDDTRRKHRQAYTSLVREIEEVREIRHDLEAEGGIAAPIARRLIKRFGDKRDGLAMRLLNRWPVPYSRLPESIVKGPGRPRKDDVEALRSVLHIIDQHLRPMEKLREELETHESKELEAERISASLPQGPSAVVGLRYRTGIERSYYLALKEFRKMKAQNNNGRPPADNGTANTS
jgi:hypothetical protein